MAIPAGSLLYVAESLVLSSVISPWRSYSAVMLVSIEGRFASARMTSTGVVQSLPVMTGPAQRCDLSRFSNVEFNIHEDAPCSTYQSPVAM